MLVGKGWTFLHIPKCGGMALRCILQGKEVGNTQPGGHTWPIESTCHKVDWDKVDWDNRVFCIVRHPADWVRSYWEYQPPSPFYKPNYLDRFWDQDLDRFTENLTQGHEGYVSQLYQAYTERQQVQVFRLEDGLNRVMKWATGRDENVSIFNESRNALKMSEYAKNLIEKTEQPAIEKYGY